MHCLFEVILQSSIPLHTERTHTH